MSLLDDAREILKNGPGEHFPEDVPCPYCCFIPHQEECIWLAMPKIVAALEAAERLVDRFDDYDFPERAHIPGDLRRLFEDVVITLAGDDPT